MARYIDGPETAAQWIIEEWAGGKPFTETMLARDINSNLDTIRPISKEYVYYQSWSERLVFKNDMTIAQLRKELQEKWTDAYNDADSV
jgi:hypothetical protein